MRNLILSPNRLNKLQACPRLYFFNHVLNKVPIEKPKYFTEGEYLHFILDCYYRQRMSGNVDINGVILAARNKATEFDGLTIADTEFLIQSVS